MMPFLQFRGSRPGLFCDLSAGESCPLRISRPIGGTAVSPADKSRKGRWPPTSHFGKGIITLNEMLDVTNL